MIPLVAIGAFRTAVRAQPPATQTAHDLYTIEQAKRGALLYGQHCSYCHGPNLMGDGSMTPAMDRPFLARWSKGPLADLFDRIAVTMPEGAPGSLSRQEYADMLAFILQANEIPAGKTELPHDAKALKQIWLTAVDEPREP